MSPIRIVMVTMLEDDSIFAAIRAGAKRRFIEYNTDAAPAS